jgi:hypothetical protein
MTADEPAHGPDVVIEVCVCACVWVCACARVCVCVCVCVCCALILLWLHIMNIIYMHVTHHMMCCRALRLPAFTWVVVSRVA